MGVETAAIVLGSIALAAAGAQAGYGIAQGAEAKDKAQHAANDAKRAQDQILADQEAQQTKLKQDQQDAALKAAAVAARGYSAGEAPTGGKGGTILTSPLGVTNSTPVTGKTLLGG